MGNFKQSLIISFGQKYSELLINLITNIVIARLLGPEEIGLFSVIAAMTIVAHMLRDFGVSSYIVQEKDLTRDKLSSAFTLTFIWSYVIGVSLLLSKGAIADYFGREELIRIVEVLCINFFLIPFGSISLSLLRKKMDFKSLFKINVSSAFVGAATSIILALNDFSYMSMAIGSAVGTATTVALSNVYRPKGTHAFFGFRSFKTVLKFGSAASYSTILYELSNSLPEIIIGKNFGMTANGLYSRANGTVRLFHMGIMQGLVPVLLPHFVEKIRKNEDIEQVYLNTMQSLCCIAWPFFAFLFIASESVLRFLYGEAWISASSFIDYLAAAGMVAASFSVCQNFFIALGKVNEYAKFQTINQLIGLTMLLVAAMYELHWVLFAIILQRTVAFLLSCYYLSQVSALSFRLILIYLQKPLIITLMSCGPLAAIFYSGVLKDQWLLEFLIGCGVVTISWLVVMSKIDTPLSGEINRLIAVIKHRVISR